MDKKIIGGVFPDVATAEEVIKSLKRDGYNSEDISIFAYDKNKANVLEDEIQSDVVTGDEGRGKNAGKGAGIGAASGGLLGGLGGLVVGLGLLTIPGIGQIAAAGPIAAGLTGLGIGAGGGGIVGALVGLGMPEEHAKQFEGFLKKGKIIILVEADEEQENMVYRTFLAHNTENKDMYPEHARTSAHARTTPNRRAGNW
jgi:hypothetical protein